MTTLAMQYSARVEERVAPSSRKPLLRTHLTHLGISLVLLLHEPSLLIRRSRLISDEWQQILPFLTQIGCSLTSDKYPHDMGCIFLTAASSLNYKCIQELSKHKIKTSVTDSKNRCAFEIVLSKSRKVRLAWSFDIWMTIIALLSAGCNPSQACQSRFCSRRSILGICESTFQRLDWTVDEIDKLMENRESSSTIQAPEDLPIQSAEKEDSSRDPAPAPAADIQAALGPRFPWPVVRGPGITLYIDHVERRELWKSRRTPASLSPLSDVSSPIDILLAGPKSLNDPLDDLIFSEIHEDISEQLEDLDLNSEQLASPEDLSSDEISYDDRWWCCHCNDHNFLPTQPVCTGLGPHLKLCAHRRCEDCLIS